MKRSIARMIERKQTSAYKLEPLKPPTIHALQTTKSWPPTKPLSQAVLDRIAEETMSAGWSKKKNPICSSCYSMKSRSGSCYCD